MNAVPMDADYTPRYIRLAGLLRGRIEDGTYPLGSLLPSASRLAEAHTVSKTTAPFGRRSFDLVFEFTSSY